MKTSRPAAVLLLSAGLLLSGCSITSDPSSEANSEATLPARRAESEVLEKGPANPKERKPYPYDIYTHCGIKWIEFGGRWWTLDAVYPTTGQVKGEPAAQQGETVAGYMTLIDPGTATFDAAGLPTLYFTPTKQQPPGCK